MRLTNHIRNQIVNNVIASLPDKVDIKDYVDRVKPLIEEEALKPLPEEIVKAWRNERLRPYISLFYYWISEFRITIALPGTQSDTNTFKLSKETLEKVSLVMKDYQTKTQEINTARVELNNYLMSKTTVKSLLDSNPELREFIPEAVMKEFKNGKEKTNQIAIVNPLNKFKDLGLEIQVS